MRLLCTTYVVNRTISNIPIKQNRKHVKSTLALCKKPKCDEYCMILFSAQNKNGTKYALKNNIKIVLTRFVNEGKATIQLIKPEHDICVQADTVQLKSFLHLMKKVLENKVSEKDFVSCSMSVVPINANTVAPKKLIIAKRSDYPVRGFPRTLEILHINDINRSGLDKGILLLNKLRILDLSHNLIEYLPEEINSLASLTELNLSFNQMGQAAPRKWDWMGGNLSKTLKSLKLTSNVLKYLPDQLTRLYNLVSLYVDQNDLKLLPSGIGNLRNLRILSIANNHLTILPGSARKWRLDELDLSQNNFHEREQSNPAAIFPKPLPVCTLREYAAKKVLLSRLNYNSETLPITLIKYLDLAKYCVCGKACFNQFIRHAHMLFLTSIAKDFRVSTGGLTLVPMDCYFCSIKCFSSANYNRGRQPVI